MSYSPKWSTLLLKLTSVSVNKGENAHTQTCFLMYKTQNRVLFSAFYPADVSLLFIVVCVPTPDISIWCSHTLVRFVWSI